jgi:two-component system cell cycle sensor histidine kinase/response regulator CckA
LSGSGQYSLEPFDLNTATCIQAKCSCARNIRSSRSKITFISALAAEPVMIMADESHLNRAIGNLIHNAAESISEDGSVNVRTSVMQTEGQVGSFEDIPPGHYAVLEIEDTGCGVDKNDVNHLFEPFFSRKTKGDHSGSGLGLAVVHGIVKDHNSFIDVASRVGEGTTFTLYFPLMSSSRVTPPVELEVAATPQGSGRILVVDDEKIQRFTISKNLKKLGYDASVASNGHEAVALFAEAEKAKSAPPFDLVLLDMTMEIGFDGLDTYQAILELYPKQKVIMSSGHTDSKRIQAAMALGADCLPKPFQRYDLAAALQKTLGEGLTAP